MTREKVPADINLAFFIKSFYILTYVDVFVAMVCNHFTVGMGGTTFFKTGITCAFGVGRYSGSLLGSFASN